MIKIIWQGPIGDYEADCEHEECTRGCLQDIARGREPEWDLCAERERAEDMRAESCAHDQEMRYGIVPRRDGN